MSNPPPNVFLFGLGAVGATYAYILQKEKQANVTVCARSNYAHVASEGLNFQSEKYGNTPNLKFAGAVKAPTDATSTVFDYVVMTNKAITMTPSASEQIAPVVTPGKTTIVIIQNGVGNGDEFKERFPENVVLSGVTWVNAAQPTTGTIVHKGDETMQMGVDYTDKVDKSVQEAKLDEFANLLTVAGSGLEKVPNVQQWRWKKTIWNCCWNSLTAMSLCNTQQYLEASESGERVARAIIAECALVARTLGHEIEDEYLESLITRKDLREGGIYSSMYMDAKNARPMEVDLIVSKPLEYARKLKLDTPVLDTFHAVLKAMDYRFQNGIVPK